MTKLIEVVGASGVGKTALVRALERTGRFMVAYEQHHERPFQKLFKGDSKYALANQIDYLLLRAEQEKKLRAAPQPGLMDGGLDLDFHGFTRLFHHQGLLTDSEYDLCRRVYAFIRERFPQPELIVRLYADDTTVSSRLSRRERINIVSSEDTARFNFFLDQWIAGIPSDQLLTLDVSFDDINYSQSLPLILARLHQL
jgi:deoxyadenosine/deoxycytidine kinase